MDCGKSSEEIEDELLQLVDEGNDQTWLYCVDGKKDVLYDLSDFLDIRKPLRPIYAVIQGEGTKHYKRGKVRPKLDELSKDSSKIKNPETKENESSVIHFNISQTEPTLYFQELQKPTPFSSSGSNIKRPSMFDSFIEKCDRSLLEDVEIPKSNLSLVSMCFEDSGDTSSEKLTEKKIDTKTFTRPKRTSVKPKVKDPSSRKSFIDELAMRYSTEYVNVDAVSPDIESPLDVGERSLDVMSSTVVDKTNVVELNETFTKTEENLYTTMIIHNRTSSMNDVQADVSGTEKDATFSTADKDATFPPAHKNATFQTVEKDGTFCCDPPKHESANPNPLQTTVSSGSSFELDMDLTMMNETYHELALKNMTGKYGNPSSAAAKMPTINDEAFEFQPTLVSTPMKTSSFMNKTLNEAELKSVMKKIERKSTAAPTKVEDDEFQATLVSTPMKPSSFMNKTLNEAELKSVMKKIERKSTAAPTKVEDDEFQATLVSTPMKLSSFMNKTLNEAELKSVMKKIERKSTAAPTKVEDDEFQATQVSTPMKPSSFLNKTFNEAELKSVMKKIERISTAAPTKVEDDESDDSFVSIQSPSFTDMPSPPLKKPSTKAEECVEHPPPRVSTTLKPPAMKKPSIPLPHGTSEKSMRKVVSEENLVTQLKKPSYFGSTANLNNNNKNLGVSTESLPGPSSQIPRPKPSGIPRLASKIPSPSSRIPKPSDRK